MGRGGSKDEGVSEAFSQMRIISWPHLLRKMCDWHQNNSTLSIITLEILFLCVWWLKRGVCTHPPTHTPSLDQPLFITWLWCCSLWPACPKFAWIRDGEGTIFTWSVSSWILIRSAIKKKVLPWGYLKDLQVMTAVWESRPILANFQMFSQVTWTRNFPLSSNAWTAVLLRKGHRHRRSPDVSLQSARSALIDFCRKFRAVWKW